VAVGQPPAARAATLEVCSTDTSLRAAVDAAAFGDVISLMTGIYTENVNITGKVG
jgi:hypothetical protein